MTVQDAAVVRENADETIRSPFVILLFLTIVFMLSTIDRTILAILLEPIREEFQVPDWQLGLLSGLAFSALYAGGGIFVAILADRGDRARIINIALAIWSVMTVLCGMANSFVTLALARAGVGLGESGCLPPSHSLISDITPPHRRGSAMGIYSIGSIMGLAISYILGGWVAQHYGWRSAFLIAGIPGIMLAFAMPFIVRDPRRSVVALTAPTVPPAPLAAVKWIFGKRSMLHIFAAASLAAAEAAGVMMFVPSFLARSHGLATADIGLTLGLLIGITGSIGVFGAGWLSDRLATRNRHWMLRVPAIAMIARVPFLAIFFTVKDTNIALAAFACSGLLAPAWLAPTYAAVQSVAPANIRAMAAACLLFVYNILGLGLGPLIVGGISDSLKGLLGSESLRGALLSFLVFAVWSAFHYFRASNHLEKDMKDAETGPWADASGVSG